MLVGSFGAERELAVESTSNEHVVDLAVERQRQRVRAAVRLVRRLPSTNHERTVLQSTPTADVELGHWVTGSMGRMGPGHRVIILTRYVTRVFPVFEKMPKMQNVHLKC